MTETEKFLRWYEAEKAKGLVDLKISLARNLNMPGCPTDTTPEDVFREMNEIVRLIEAGEEVDHGEVF